MRFCTVVMVEIQAPALEGFVCACAGHDTDRWQTIYIYILISRWQTIYTVKLKELPCIPLTNQIIGVHALIIF